MIKHGILRINYLEAIRRRKFSMNSGDVIFKEINKCGIITLNRPKYLNALTSDMFGLIHPALKKWEGDSNITHVIIESSSDNAFCAGGDIRKLNTGAKIDSITSCKELADEYSINYSIGTFKKPFIALINGISMGGGVGLSVHGKYRVATEKTVFAMPETSIGLFTDAGTSYFLSRLPRHIGIYTGLTGRRFKGRDALSLGVATHYVNSNQLTNLKDDLIAASNPSELDGILNKYHESDKDHKFVLTPFIDLIDKHFSKPSMESIIDSLSEEVQTSISIPEKEWCNDQINIIRKMSPTSLKVTLRELRESRKLDFRECIIMEYRIVVRCLENKDFYEGVRALIIDKDNKPKWNPATIEEVTDKMVDQYFQPLEQDIVL